MHIQNFQGTHIYGASRGHLCDSTAFLYVRPIHVFFINYHFERYGYAYSGYIIDFPNLGITYNGGWCSATIAR